VPYDPGATVARLARRAESLLHCVVHGVELMVGGDLLLEFDPVVLKDDEVAEEAKAS